MTEKKTDLKKEKNNKKKTRAWMISKESCLYRNLSPHTDITFLDYFKCITNTKNIERNLMKQEKPNEPL